MQQIFKDYFGNDVTNTGLAIIKPQVFGDIRGYFFEAFNKGKFDEIIKDIQFIQDNQSMSSRGVLRGLHYQAGNFAQSKLVRVVKGSVFDFALDIRKDSKTFGKLFTVQLSGQNKIQFFIPKGFAHGFLCLEDETIFSYKCDNFWNKDSERGIDIFSYVDKLKNNFQFSGNYIFSQKDMKHPKLDDAKDLF